MANWTPYAPKSPGGESYREAVERATRALIETVLDSEGGTVVIVTHTVPLRASLWAFLSLPFHALSSIPSGRRRGSPSGSRTAGFLTAAT
ncbi:histidine phosphatase family protein [Actinopolymorpha pittospori]|uniref:histidine phosphatase family protein n=1 Tax=Actinopolymorpha pittospori TaxID=648752 RepID=UPI001789269C